MGAHPAPSASPAPLRRPASLHPPRPSQAIIIVRPERLSVHVTTANFIFPDWKSKTNAVASFHFGRLAGAAPAAPADGFGSDLLEYYSALKAIGHRPPPAWKVDKGQRPPTDAECAAWAVLPLGWIADYDYSGARARLVASVPGTSAGVSAGRHAGPALHRWGSAAAQARLGLMMRQAPLAPAWLP
jgi:tyrosyl-DNA phosphodiesterase-1